MDELTKRVENGKQRKRVRALGVLTSSSMWCEEKLAKQKEQLVREKAIQRIGNPQS